MLPGLNVGGAQVSVMPQFTPSNTAIDASGIGRGFSQGLGLVEQAQQARRPLRDILAERQMLEASMPVERVADIGIEETPEGVFGTEVIESIGVNGTPSRFSRRSRVLETAAQRKQRMDAEARGFAPGEDYRQRPDGTWERVIFSRDPLSAGKVIGSVEGVLPPTSMLPKPETKPGSPIEVTGPDGKPFMAASRITSSGDMEVFDPYSNAWTPFRGASKPEKNAGGLIERASAYAKYAAAERAAGRKPVAFAEWSPEPVAATSPFVGAGTQPGPVSSPAPNRIRYGYDSATGTWGLKPSDGQ